MASRRLPALLVAVGLLSSAALEWVHYRAYTEPSASSFCSIGSGFDCSTVALSRASVLFGVPLPLWGLLGFQAMGLALRARSALLLPLTALAAAASLALLGLELVSIHSVCLLCEVVHVVSLALFAWTVANRHALVPVTRTDAVDSLGPPAFLLAFAFVITPHYWAVFTWRSTPDLPQGKEADGSQWVGAEHPSAVVHEYTDYGCPHCAVATNQLRSLLIRHPKAVRIVHHNYPRMACRPEGGALACVFARIANCAADQGKFWEADSWLFEHAGGKQTVDASQMAKDLGIDPAKLQACVDDPGSYARADAEWHAALAAHVRGSPTFVLDGKRYEGGDVFPVLKQRL